jgi:cytochrome c-type biogenesis protein CcmH
MPPFWKLCSMATLAALVTLCALPAAAQAPDSERAASAQQDDFSEYVPGAAALEGRIIAPCCWTQTIDIHGSDIATELRHEIRRRLKAGESAQSIQADLVNRYGERILAVPPGNPLKDVGIWLSIAFGIAGVGAGLMVFAWRRRAEAAKVRSASKKGGDKGDKPRRDRLDDQIDAELDNL